MIKKLVKRNNPLTMGGSYDTSEMASKINELVDVINAIQKEREAERFEIQEWIGILEAVRESVNVHERQIDKLQMRDEDLAERINYTLAKATGDKEALKLLDEKYKPVDMFAEQRKWIGKLCRFWDDNYKTIKHFGILTRIDEKAIVPYEAENGFWYCACEPVKPDDDIIYKGDDK